MFKTKLTKVGGSQMLAVPPAVVKMMGLRAGAEVEMTIEGDRLVVAVPRQKVRLEALLAMCQPDLPVSQEDREWAAGGPVGGELI